MFRKTFFLVLGLSILNVALSAEVTDDKLQKIGQKIFWNECKGNAILLTHWNQGENFGSFGIGHFIWYPENKKGIYDECFPQVLTLLKTNGVKLPDFLQPGKPCPWKNREDFYKDYNSEKMAYLRKLLNSTKSLQTKFMINKFEESISKIKKAASPGKQENVEKYLNLMLQSEDGLYSLVDYVNFKGNGTNPSENYKGQRWGLLQVLENMKNSDNYSDAIKNFAISAKFILKKRIENSPNKKQEQKWLSGWLKRIDTYKKDSIFTDYTCSII